MIAGSLYRRIDILANHMKRAELGDYRLIPDTKMGNDELGLLMNSMNKMLEKIRSLIEDVYKAKIRETQLELLKNQAELKALQGQVNPHFMFNVLETIRMKSYLKNEYETARIIRNMSFIFRKILTWPEDMVTIREEIDFIKEYLEIQKYRYEEELEYLIDVDESILDFMIPKMTLQTFVDNSCEHGFSETNGLKKLVIRGIKDEDKLILKVYDNGKGMTQDEIKNINSLSGKGIGIKNVLGRLELYYADQCEFEIDSRLGEYTKIIIRISLDQGGSQELVQGNDS
jgi:two-component system sensor histidine kinase YesM